jgi:hypothetical protein
LENVKRFGLALVTKKQQVPAVATAGE